MAKDMLNPLLNPSPDVLGDYCKAEQLSLVHLVKYLQHKEKDLTKIKIALGTLAVIKGNRQSFSAQRAIDYQIMRDISKDKTELKAYVKATCPQLEFVK